MDITDSECKSPAETNCNPIIQQTKVIAKRPPPLKIPEKIHVILEIPEDMIEWHGILLPISDCVSPVTPSHWTRRIEEPIIRNYYDQITTVLTFLRGKHNMYQKWSELEPAEFLPNVYLASYYDVFRLNHNIRVSVMDDFSMFHLLVDHDKKIDDPNTLEIYAKDNGDTNIMSHFNAVRDFLDKQSDDDIKIIHCVAGMNRSATLAVAYYMHKTKCSLINALQHMVALRPIILRNDNFLKQLVVWSYDNGFLDL